MVALVVHYVRGFEIDLRLNLHMPNLVRFLIKLQAGYHDVPFHNYIHACDVVHGTVFFASQEVYICVYIICVCIYMYIYI